jgi:dTDP-4-amino-4,6-dideoxygalactose transaminase
MIAIGLSPNTERDDVLLALSVLITPWRWIKGSALRVLEDWFRRYFRMKFAIPFDSGRSCEYAILKAVGINSGDEVLIQPFTCVAVPNSILWSGAKPVYVDIDKTGNIDASNLEKKITRKSRAIIVHHTLGIAANVEKIREIAKKHNLVLIEDCAHALGATCKGRKLGTFGDVSFFSFGRDKVVSSVFGGMVITNNKRYAQNIRNFQRGLPFPSFHWIFAQLFHPVAFVVILPLYNTFNIGKIILVLLQKVKVLSVPVEASEKEGKRPLSYPKRFPNAQALLALNQLRKLEKFNKHRREVAKQYKEALQNLPVTLPRDSAEDIFLRYNLETKDALSIYAFFRKKNVILGRWYCHTIDPKGVILTKVGYQQGSCPRAELFAANCLNLPTYPRMTMADAHTVIRMLKEYYEKN